MVLSDCDLCRWGLVCKGLWELSLRAGSRAVWEIVGTGENRLEGRGSCWNVWACCTPPSFIQGWALLVEPALSPFFVCPQLCHHVPASCSLLGGHSVPPCFLLGYNQLTLLGKALGRLFWNPQKLLRVLML